MNKMFDKHQSRFGG